MITKKAILLLVVFVCIPSILGMELSPEELTTELKNAIFNDNPQKASKMLIAGANPNERLYGTNSIRLGQRELQTHLIAAAATGCPQICQMLIERGANIQQADDMGWTPLHWAARLGKTDICQLLLAHNASSNASSIEQESHDKNNPLDLAAFQGHTDIISLLITDYGHKLFLLKKEKMIAQIAAGESSDEVIAQARADIKEKIKPFLAHAHPLATVHLIKLILDPNDFGSNFGPVIEEHMRKELGLLKTPLAPTEPVSPNGNSNNQKTDNEAPPVAKNKKKCAIQ